MSNDNDEAKPAYRKKKARDIFAVDYRAWSKVCGLGMNAAVAYLVLARGSGPDQRTVGWSVHAIENWTGISRPNAKKALEALKRNGLVRQLKGGTKPLYYIVPAHQLLPDTNRWDALTEDERRVLDLIASGNNAVPKVGRHDNVWKFGNPYTIALDLALKGYVKNRGGHRFEVTAKQTDQRVTEEPDWIWLPNTVIDGADGEIPPVELIRQSQNLAALRLFIDLYKAQDLRGIGGVPWRPGSVGIRQNYERHHVGEYGQYVIWGFEAGATQADVGPLVTSHFTRVVKAQDFGEQTYTCDTGWRVFWDAFGLLRDAGLVSMVPHLIESYTDEGEIILSQGYVGEDGERDVARATLEAAESMLAEWQLQRLANENNLILIPVLKHLANVQLVGIARLRYRAQTEATAEWLNRESAKWAEWAKRYSEMATAKQAPAARMQHQG